MKYLTNSMKQARTVLRTAVCLLALCLWLLPASAFAADAAVETSEGFRYGEMNEPDSAYAITSAKYPAIMNMLTNRGYMPVPGLEHTAYRELGTDGALSSKPCYDMIPQGLCATERYLLITAYCFPSKASIREHDHPSMVYVVDRSSGKFLCALSLYKSGSFPGVTEVGHPDFTGAKKFIGHVGGITCDRSDTVWIPDGAFLRKLSLAQIDEAVKSASEGKTGKAVAVTLSETIDLHEHWASFLAWYDDKLWVGYSNPDGDGSITGFEVSGNGDTVNEICQFVIPRSANGMVFYKAGDHDCLAVNCSYGRSTYSRMFLYEARVENNGSLTSYGSYILPPMAEEMDICDGKLYMIFESAATEYSTKTKKAKYIVDGICAGSAPEFFYWTLPGFDLREDDYQSESGAWLTRSTVYPNSELYGDPEDCYQVDCEYYSPTGSRWAEGDFIFANAMMIGSRQGAANPDLAKVGVSLSAAAYGEDSINDALVEMGFTKVNLYNYNRPATCQDNDFVAFSISERRVLSQDSVYTLYIAAIRGTPESAEWYSNFNLGDGNRHRGFELSAQEVLDKLESDFFSTDGSDPAHRRILITGHSRGGAVANLVAGELTKGWGGYCIPAGVYGYTFACPNVDKNADTHMDNIANYNFSGDPITVIPLRDWGFRRYGRDYSLDSDDDVYHNMLIQFRRVTGGDFCGSRGCVDSYAKSLKGFIGSQADYYQPTTLRALDLLAYLLGGRNAPDAPSYIDEILGHPFTNTSDFISSLFMDVYSYGEFVSIAVEYEASMTALLDELTASTELYNADTDDFDDWLDANRSKVDELIEYTGIDADSMDSIVVGISMLGRDVDVLRRLKNNTLNLIGLFFDTSGMPMPAMIYGHAPETYVLLINSRYYGYEGWYGRADVTDVDFNGVETSVGGYCFYGCAQLSDLDGLHMAGMVGSGAFYGCEALTSLEIPNDVVTLGRYAFRDCTGLSAVRLPVELSLPDVFNGCTHVETIFYTARDLGVMPDRDLNGDDDPEEHDGDSEYTLEFASRDALCGVVFDEGVTYIGANAFNASRDHYIHHTPLTSVTLPSTVRAIGDYAFYRNENLEINALPEELEALGYYCFCCTAITDPVIPAGVMSIPTMCFGGCPEIRNLVIPNTVEELGYHAFFDCEGLTSVTLPAELSGFNIFDDCENVQTIRYTARDTGIMPDRSRDQERRSGDCRAYTLEYICQQNLSEVIFEEGVTHIGAAAFDTYTWWQRPDASQALLSVTLPATLESIGDYAFYRNANLNLHELPAALKSLGAGCFFGTEIDFNTVPSGIAEIPEDAFGNCFGLKDFVIPDTVEALGARAFGGCAGLTALTLPAELTLPDVFIGCVNVETIRYTTRDTGAMPDRTSDSRERERYLEWVAQAALSEVIFDEGVTHIAAYGFFPDNENSKKLLRATFPATLKSIGDCAFLNNEALEIEGLPEGLETLGESCFRSTGIIRLTLPAGLREIPDWCFAECRALTTLTIPDSVEAVGSYAFYNCQELSSVVLPDGLMEIRAYAFYVIGQPVIVYPYSVGLSYAERENVPYILAEYDTLTLPDMLSAVEDEAFAGTKAEQAVFSEGCKRIGSRVFSGGAMRVVVISSESVEIADDAFVDAPVRVIVCERDSDGWRWAANHGFETCEPEN